MVMDVLQKEMKFAWDHPHQHIVGICGYCEQPPALVYEYMSGGDLQDTLNSHDKLGKLTLLHRVQILVHAAAGLDHLHTNRIIHKDVKPANVMLHW